MCHGTEEPAHRAKERRRRCSLPMTLLCASILREPHTAREGTCAPIPCRCLLSLLFFLGVGDEVLCFFIQHVVIMTLWFKALENSFQ